jgi:hypothetical protein
MLELLLQWIHTVHQSPSHAMLPRASVVAAFIGSLLVSNDRSIAIDHYCTLLLFKVILELRKNAII